MSAPQIQANGIVVSVRDGWEAELSDLDGDSRRSLVHLGNFALPVVRGDYGSGAVDIMGPAGIFMVLMEFAPESANSALFQGKTMPQRLRMRDFSTQKLQRQLPNQLGSQHFFVVAARPFVLYVVLGSSLTASVLLAEANRALAGITIGATTTPSPNPT